MDPKVKKVKFKLMCPEVKWDRGNKNIKNKGMTDWVNYSHRKCLWVFSKPSPFSRGHFTALKTLARNTQRFWSILRRWAVINVERDNDGDESIGDLEKVIG